MNEIKIQILSLLEKSSEFGFLKEHVDALITNHLRLEERSVLNRIFPSEVLNKIMFEFTFTQKKRSKFTFIDLFAGIGGFHLALSNLGGECLFSSEWDKSAKQTYFRNFSIVPFGDICDFTNESVSDQTLNKLIPDHDILCAGFPCQPFSRAGVSARESIGIKHGFECETQGNLFFDLVRIAKIKRPKVLFLENVKNLKSHDSGNTFKTICQEIEEKLGYKFFHQVINAKTLVPQKRERCFMVAFRDDIDNFDFGDFSGDEHPLSSILEKKVPDTYTISDRLWEGHQRRTKNNLSRGTGFTAFTADLNKPANTIVARYGKDGKECLIPQKNKNPRKLTPRECARLQGFPESYILPSSNAASYRQFGNSLVVPVVDRIAKNILKVVDNHDFQKNSQVKQSKNKRRSNNMGKGLLVFEDFC